MAVKTYIITKGKHTRFEFANGEPLTKENKARTEKEKAGPVHYNAASRNEIKLDAADAGRPSYAHLGLVLKITGKTPAPAKAPEKEPETEGAGGDGETGEGDGEAGDGDSDVIAIPDGWEALGLQEKRELAAKITGRRANRSVTTCDTIIQEYVNGAATTDA